MSARVSVPPKSDVASQASPALTRVSVRLANGTRFNRVIPIRSHMVFLLDVLDSGRPGFIEVIGAKRGVDGRLGRFARSDRRNFVPAHDRAELLERIRAAADGSRSEVFFTPAVLDAPVAGNDSVSASVVSWVDIDEPANVDRLRAFPARPHAVVASGSGGVHAYWRLDRPVSGRKCEEVNRKLASAVGADMASCNRGRILRVPGTRNYKHAPADASGAWCLLLMCDLASPGYPPEQLVDGIEDPQCPRPVQARRSRRSFKESEPWSQMEPADYYRAIIGLEPPRDGRVHCPNAQHEDRHPSTQLYRGPDSGWYCFSCGAGGRAPDMVAAIRGWPTGRALGAERFKECVAELRRIFGVEDLPAVRGRARG